MPAARASTKGPDLEEVLAAYFRSAGYFVVRGVPYQLDGEDVTDVDLWLYERASAGHRRRLIVDIKNKRSPRAAERLIWTKGLQASLGVDAAFVATTDRRESTRRLARSLGISLLDGDAIARLNADARLKADGRIPADDFDARVKRVDSERRTAAWRDHLLAARSSLLTSFGAPSANLNLGVAGFFAGQAASAHPASTQAELATRLAYLAASMACVSLDAVLASHAFRPPDEVKSAVVNGIRYGQSEGPASLATLHAAIGLARAYADNGAAVGRQIERGFFSAADAIPAEIVADFVCRRANGDALFSVARNLQEAAMAANLPSFDTLTVEDRALLGVILDFGAISRAGFANAWPPNQTVSSVHRSESRPRVGRREEASSVPLFEQTSPTSEREPGEEG